MAKRSFKKNVEQELGKIPQFIIFAVLEWLLIFILFVDGILAFLSNVFAKFFELRIPCLLCTRLDHVLVHRNPDFYYNESICEAHKKHLSSLAYCHIHKKLSDIRKMCEGCLLSFATEKETDCDTYKSLIGILHKDLELFVDDDQDLHLALPAGHRRDDIVHMGKISSHLCSCCGEPLKAKPSSYSKAKNPGLTNAPTPSPRAPFAHSNGSKNLESPHIRYSELKFIGDHETEVHEDDENSRAVFKQFGEDGKATTVPLLTDADDEDKTPNFAKGNKFFGIPLTDSANSTPRWTTRRKSPLEKTEFAGESTEGQVPHEVDGDSILYSLNKQVRLDRKSLMELYMELDEERNASAVAANNAMAMITRLQAEKAAVQMEALQYQRMMEEQAEYDEEALQATKDLLDKREEEFRDLEAELEAYRLKYGCLSEEDYVNVRPGDETDEDYQEMKSHHYDPYHEKSDSSSPRSVNDSPHGASENVGGSLERSSSRTERASSLGRLKSMDKKVQVAGESPMSSQSSSENTYFADQGKEGTKPDLMKELSDLSERVKTLEADGGISEHGNDSEGGKMMSEISDNLEKLHHFVLTPFGNNDA